jgi:hypothetical protein
LEGVCLHACLLSASVPSRSKATREIIFVAPQLDGFMDGVCCTKVILLAISYIFVFFYVAESCILEKRRSEGGVIATGAY